MKKNVIAVCDTDEEYACNFAEYLNSRKKLPFQAEAFTDVEKLCHYAGKTPPEILLIAESDVDSQVENLNTENVILLSEEKEENENKGKHKCVYKYQSAESVIQEVMEYYTRNSAAVLFTMAERKMSVIGVYSPVGRCAKTIFALTAGQVLGENRSVLYLNMEDYSGFEQFFCREYEKNLSDFFYDLRCKESGFAGELADITERLGTMDYIPPAASPEDIRAVRFTEWMQLFDFIRMGSRYEVLILDIGSSVDQLFKILGLCSRIYMPVQEDKMSRCKIAQFKKLMQYHEDAEEEKKIKEIRLPGVCPDLSNPEVMETLVWGKWGAYVRKVLETDEKYRYTGK